MTGAATAARKALLVATYDYRDPGLRELVAPAQDAEALAEVLRDPAVAGFDVTVLLNQPAHVVGEAIADFYGDCRRDDLTVLYFSGHGLKDDDGRLYLAMTNTRRDALLFTGLAAAQIDEAMTACVSRRKVLILDCCYSGAFPAGHTAKADESVHTLERFQGKGRAVLTASDSTQYSFEGENVTGSGAGSLFTRFLVEGIRSGEADLDADGDIALDELYSYVHDRVVTEMPQQRPKKQEDVDGRIVLARNVHWSLPAYVRNAIDSPIAAQRRAAVDELAHLHRVGNELVRSAVRERVGVLADDDSRAVSAAAVALLARIEAGDDAPAPVPAPVSVPEPPETAPEPVVPVAPAPVAAAPVAASPVAAAPVAAAPAAAPAAADPMPRVWPLLAAVVVAFVLLEASRYAVFEADNGYRESDLGWSTPIWAAQVVLPLLLAAGLLVRGRTRWRIAAVGTGVVAGVLLTMLGQVLQWAAAFTEAGYQPGPAVWLLISGTVVLALGVTAALAGRRPEQRSAVRRDAVAAVAAAAVVVALLLWLFGIGPVDLPPGQWLLFKGGGLLFTLACVPVAVLRLAERRRLVGLAMVATTGVASEVAAVALLVEQRDTYSVPALLTAMLAVLLSAGGAYLGQRAPRAAGQRVSGRSPA